MATASTTEQFNCSPKEFFKIITDYESYSRFLPEVKSCRVLRQDEGKKLVEFQLSLIRTFTYRLWIKEKEDAGLSWELESGDIFKTNSGRWEIEENNKGVKVTYFIEATFNLFVPGPIAKALVGVNLPNMMKAHQKRVRDLYGK